MALIGKEVRRLSYKFLYPFITMDTDSPFDISGTYCYWDGEENIENLMLLVHYKHKLNYNLFNMFESNHILKSNKIRACYKVEDGTVYVYDMIENADEVFHFIDGSYSELSPKSKARILKFNNISSSISVAAENPIHMYLYPEKYYDKIAEELGYEDIRHIKGRELGKKPNKERETLNIKIIENGNCVPEKIIYY